MSAAIYVLLLCYMVAALIGHVIFWTKRQYLTASLIAALSLGFALQIFVLLHDLIAIGHVWGSASFNFVFVLSLLWTGAALLVFALTRKTVMALFAGPLALLCLGAAAALPGTVSMGEAHHLKSVWLSAHIHLMLLAYAALGLGFICALAYLGTAFRLQRKMLMPSAASLSLESLNRWVQLLSTVGVILLSFGLMAGWVWADLSWQGAWLLDPKIMASLQAWALSAVVVVLRSRGKLQGRLGMWLIILSFGLILLGLLLDQMIPSTYHHFL